MVCNKCGTVCDDYATVCSTCGEVLSEAFEIEKTPEELQKEKTAKILGIVSICCAPVSVLVSIIGAFCCMSWLSYVLNTAGVVTGIIGIAMGGNQKKLGIIGVILNVLVVVVPIVLGVLLYVLMICGIIASEAMYY